MFLYVFVIWAFLNLNNYEDKLETVLRTFKAIFFIIFINESKVNDLYACNLVSKYRIKYNYSQKMIFEYFYVYCIVMSVISQKKEKDMQI